MFLLSVFFGGIAILKKNDALVPIPIFIGLFILLLVAYLNLKRK